MSATVLLLALAGLGFAEHGLRYASPADDSDRGWEQQSLPIGCGYFGANVFGNVTNERVQVTHNALHNVDPQNPKKANLTDALEIRLRTDHRAVTNYVRGLDFASAVAWVEYDADGVRYRREFFASYPDKVLVLRLTASEKGRLSFALDPVAPFLREGRRTATRTVRDGVVGVYQELADFAIRFDAELAVVTDGQVSSDGLSVTGATEATVIASFASNYRLLPKVFLERDNRKKLEPIDPRPEARKILASAVRKGYAALRETHVRDFSALYGRVSFDLGGDAADAAVPTDELLRRYRAGRPSRYLEETYVQYGRYLLISSSRPGTLPANLQGVWNCHEFSPWGSGYWHNINVQMNYWPAFSGNLAECFEPYADYNEAFRPSKSRDCYNFIREYVPENLPRQDEPIPAWWCVGTANYPYVALGGPGAHDGPGNGGLTTRLFSDWWEFTQDREILAKRAFPALHGMAEFLTRCVRNYDGKWLSVFSASPEQVVVGRRESWTDRDVGIPYYHTIGCAFDQQLLWQNAHDLLAMADALGTNDAVIAKCREQIGRYDPVQIGASGQIKEYREENAYGEIGDKRHRHISQLMGLMPGTLVTRETPDWLAAAKRTLELRGDHSTGWALAHRLNAWARTGDGEHAYGLFGNLLGERTYDNLWDAHPPFQIDGNFGGTAGVIEMLLQSHAGFVELLPALPQAWAKKGSFRGLCARGAFEIDCDWTNGVPARVEVRSRAGLKPDIRFRGKSIVAGSFAQGVSSRELPPDIFKKGEKVLFIGDSITHGGRMGDMNHYLGHGFAAEIAMRYLAYRPELDLQFANRGISGDSSSNVVARWSTDAVPFTPDENGYDGPFPGSRGKPVIPDWMNILVGCNDDWKVKLVPFADYEKNLRYMLDTARKANPKMKIVICEEFRPLNPDGTERASENTLRRREVVRRLVKEYGLIYVPFNDFFQKTLMAEKPQMKWWLWDNVHPTYAGHMRMADFWLETVAKAVGHLPATEK